MGQDDGHHAVLLKEVEAMQQKGEVRCRLRCQAIVLEADVLTQSLARLPAVAERRVGHNGIESGHLGRVSLA
ncbi:hypothetical protein D9M68_966060 [compost metagenome]